MSQNAPNYPMTRQTNPPIRLLAKYQELYGPPEIVYQAPRREMWIAAKLTSDARYSLLSLESRATTGSTILIP